MHVAEQFQATRPGASARPTPRVLFIVPQPLKNPGGVETVTNLIIEGLRDRGWEVSYLVAHIIAWDEAAMETEAGVAVDLPTYLKDQKIDVLVNQHSFECAFSCLFQRLACEVPLINVFHSTPSGGGVRFNAPVWIQSLRQRGWGALRDPRWVLYPLIYWLKMRNPPKYGDGMRINHDVSDCFVMLSERFYPEFKRRSGVSDLTKVRVIPNPLRYAWAEPVAGPRERIFLVVSRLTESEKRLSRVLRLWRELDSGRGTGWRLVIVGDGRDREYYERMARKLKLENLVFTGAVQDPQPYYQRASVLLLTSAYEGWAMVLSEALQHGVIPVVLDTFESLRDIVTHDETGLIVPADKATGLTTAARRLMEDEALRTRLACNGPASVRHLELSRIVECWENLLEEVTARA